MAHDAAEVEAATRHYLERREACGRGELPWSALAELFTDDIVFVDPAWGRLEGIGIVTEELLGNAMVGLDGWEYPTDLVMVQGDDVIVKWRQVIPGGDGRGYEQSGYSHLVYAGGGRFRFEEDLLNMAHVMEDLTRSGWRPPPGVSPHVPPAEPDRDFSVPPAAGDR